MELHEALRGYIINELFKGKLPKDFDDTYDLIDSGFMDSLSMMGLITYLEKQHQVEFGMNEIVPENLKSINALSVFIENKTSSSPNGSAGE